MVKNGYKQTEVGVIPDDWDIKHLDDFGTIVGGGTPSTSVKEYWDGYIAWCTPSDITSTNGNYISKTERNITLKGFKNSAATMLPPRSILLCTRATIGELKISTIQMATNQGFKNVILNKSGSAEFLYYLLQTKKSNMIELAIGSTFLEISKKSLCSILLQSPPLCEQQRIAEALSDVDGMISSLEKLIAKYKSIKTACLQQMFPQNGETVPRMRLPGFTGAWEQRKLSELASIHARIGWQNLRTSEFLDSGDYMLITGTDFNDGAINFSTCHYVERERYEQDRNIQIHNGSILITKDGTLGKVAYVQGVSMPATLNAGVFNVQIKDANIVDEKYLFQYLKAPYLMDYVSKKATGGTIKHLNQNILVDFPVVMPKKSEQILIGAYFQQLDSLITFHQRKLEKVQKIKQGMMQQLLTGKIRLV